MERRRKAVERKEEMRSLTVVGGNPPQELTKENGPETEPES